MTHVSGPRLFDQHLHSRHSFDSKADPRANVLSALERGLAGLTFTEHFDTHPDDWPSCVFNDAEYSETIRGLRQEFGEQIFIGKGIEVCFQAERMEFVLDFLSRHQFDLVILSIHYFDGKPVHKKRSWEHLSAEQGTQRYLRAVVEALRWCETNIPRGERPFDILGHMDLAKRYTRRYFECYDMAPFADLLDEALRGCLAIDLIPEINTSSLRQGLQEPMPGLPTVRRYAELGGRAMSLGSDSHRAEDIGAGLDVGAAMLREAGLQSAIFKNRELQKVSGWNGTACGFCGES